nr:GNAT family N-acetyltransferase [Georgenia subflava]
MDEADIEAHIATHLGAEHFAAYLADPSRYRVLVAETAAGLVGYTLLVLPLSVAEAPEADDVAAVVTQRPVAELSKCYLLPAFQGTGLAGVLVRETTTTAAGVVVEDRPLSAVWLGTNRSNRRAQRSYARNGFTVVGTRRYRVGQSLEEDVVMTMPLDVPQTTAVDAVAR